MESLDVEQRRALENAGLLTPLDVLLLPPHELAQKLQVTDAQDIIDAISRAIAPQPVIIDSSFNSTAESISTGDDAFNALLGGGIVTGAIWEVVGESSSGKTQLALQISLMALLSPISGAIERSTCYITSNGELPTERLVQIFNNHPKLSHLANKSHERLMLDNIQQRHIPSRRELIRALSDDLPKLAEQRILLGMPLKLLVIDALTPLVQLEGKANTARLTERSQHLVEISSLLRSLAWNYNLAVLIINHVTDVFEDNHKPSGSRYSEMDYKCQANWFSRTPLHLAREGVTNRKEASLGLVWANQLNARIMLSRTSRKRPLSDLQSHPGPSNTPNAAKRLRLDTPVVPDMKFLKSESSTDSTPHLPSPTTTTTNSSSSTPIRKFSVLYSAYGPPGTLSYVIVDSGVSALQDGPSPPPPPLQAQPPSSPRPPAHPPKQDTTPKPNSTSIKAELSDEEWALHFPELFQPGWDSDF